MANLSIFGTKIQIWLYYNHYSSLRSQLKNETFSVIFKHCTNFWRNFFFGETDSWWCEEGRSFFFPFSQCLSLGGKQFYITTFSRDLMRRSRKFHISFSCPSRICALHLQSQGQILFLIRTRKKQQKIFKEYRPRHIYSQVSKKRDLRKSFELKNHRYWKRPCDLKVSNKSV